MNQRASSFASADTAAAAPVRPRLVALVVTFNRKAQLQTTLSRLLGEEIDALVVVDNACTDGTSEMLRQITDPRLQVLRLAENVGGAGGFEAGLEEVRRRFDPDWCVLMDDDARPEPGALARFRTRAPDLEAQGWDAFAAGVFYPDGRICDMNRPWRNPFWHKEDFRKALFGGRAGFHLKDSDYLSDQPVPIDGTSFVGFFLSRKGLALAGLPEADLFIYADDVIYTLKLTRQGGRIGFLADVRFEHDCATYQSGGGDIYRPLWKVYYNYRNSLLAYRVAAGPLFFWPVFLLAALKWRIRARHAGADRRAYLTLYRMALADALLRRLTRRLPEIQAIANQTDPAHGAARSRLRRS